MHTSLATRKQNIGRILAMYICLVVVKMASYFLLSDLDKANLLFYNDYYCQACLI